jgi:peptide-methionine (S)-S-oxide reductase
MLTATVVREYDREAADCRTERATFGVGCFWGPDAAFGALDGVVRTRVGYAGGSKPDPTYGSLGDHTEVVQVEFDPDRLAYREVVAEVFAAHNPYQQPAKRQYQNVVLAESEAQFETVGEFLDDSDFDPARVETRIEGLGEFTPAEHYHQKYSLRGKRWAKEPFEEAGYDAEAIRESPAAAKLNADLAGHDAAAAFLDARTR